MSPRTHRYCQKGETSGNQRKIRDPEPPRVIQRQERVRARYRPAGSWLRTQQASVSVKQADQARTT